MNSKRKGARVERDLAAFLRALGFAGAKRGQQYKGSPDSPDIDGAIEGVHIECKGDERLNVHKALEQAEVDAGAFDIPCVMHKKNRKAWLFTCRLVDLVDLAYAVRREVERRPD